MILLSAISFAAVVKIKMVNSIILEKNFKDLFRFLLELIRRPPDTIDSYKFTT